MNAVMTKTQAASRAVTAEAAPPPIGYHCPRCAFFILLEDDEDLDEAPPAWRAWQEVLAVLAGSR